MYTHRPSLSDVTEQLGQGGFLASSVPKLAKMLPVFSTCLSLCVIPSVCRHATSREVSYLLDLMTLDIMKRLGRFVDSPIFNNSRHTVQARCTVRSVLLECPVCIHTLAKYFNARRMFGANTVEKTDTRIACRSVHFYGKSYHFRDN
jgi:hypothetical protein